MSLVSGVFCASNPSSALYRDRESYPQIGATLARRHSKVLINYLLKLPLEHFECLVSRDQQGRSKFYPDLQKKVGLPPTMGAERKFGEFPVDSTWCLVLSCQIVNDNEHLQHGILPHGMIFTTRLSDPK